MELLVTKRASIRKILEIKIRTDILWSKSVTDHVRPRIEAMFSDIRNFQQLRGTSLYGAYSVSAVHNLLPSC